MTWTLQQQIVCHCRWLIHVTNSELLKLYGSICCSAGHRKDFHPFTVAVNHNTKLLTLHFSIINMNSLPRFSKLLFYNNKGTALGAWCALVQTWQSLTFSSTSRSIPGQHTNDLASAFTRHIPGWHSCNISDNCLCHLLTSSCITWPLLPKIPQHQFDALFFVCCFFLLPISTAILCNSLFVGIRMYW